MRLITSLRTVCAVIALILSAMIDMRSIMLPAVSLFRRARRADAQTTG